ncbi:hypothetical protein PDE_02027 [Penicillium oxalicum 114-2]|uniref:Uncharacterized protein n=1 Tax=Penicillium oxalicum (strain 114-2 / CGMCC 5302) TaxID=933388 RepID=S7ZEH2_PENO1|nr:hypothetical protein PDE_02027 [Penicillium oxalicum 114-2]
MPADESRPQSFFSPGMAVRCYSAPCRIKPKSTAPSMLWFKSVGYIYFHLKCICFQVYITTLGNGKFDAERGYL